MVAENKPPERADAGTQDPTTSDGLVSPDRTMSGLHRDPVDEPEGGAPGDIGTAGELP